MNKLSPAYLFTGSQYTTLVHEVQAFIKKIFCMAQGCNNCHICLQIEQKQYYLLNWFTPQSNYTLSQLEMVHNVLSLALESEQHYFFVFERAELLLGSAAHHLLTSLEEPTIGYHFILITTRPNALLDTIRSRCVLYRINSTDVQEQPQIARFFIEDPYKNMAEFGKELDRSKITEIEIGILLDYLYAYWMTRYKKDQEQLSAEKMLMVLDQAYAQLPMPGSAKIFLKNIFLQYMLIWKSKGN